MSLHYHEDMNNPDDPLNQEERSYELPSKEIIQVGHKTRFNATEILFNPGLIKDESHEERNFDGIA